MLVDSQIKEAYARAMPVSVSLVEHDCCENSDFTNQSESRNVNSDIESLVCPNNWQNQLVPREFIELTLAFHAITKVSKNVKEELC